MINEELKKMLKMPIQEKPEAYLLGMLEKDILQKKRKIFLYATAATRIVFERDNTYKR